MGKSTAATLLAAEGIPVVDTDVIAREIVAPGQPALAEICEVFGREMIDSTGALRRDAMAELVFGDASKRQQLEVILHPRIRECWQAKLEAWSAAGQRAGVVVIPLLFETGAEKELDRVACVACSTASQLSRLQTRGWSVEQCRQRIAAQWPTQRKVDLSHGVVWTEGRREVHAEQWRHLLRRWVG